MSKLCKTYIGKIKALFPIIGKSELKYIKTIKINVDDFLADKPNNNLEDLYKGFGNLEEVVNAYYISIDTNNIIKRIKLSKYTKIFIFVLIVCLLSLAIWSLHMKYKEHQVFMEEQIYS